MKEAPDSCSGDGEIGYDIWLYHAGSGWWIDEREVDDAKLASSMLSKKIGKGNVVAGAILPAGNPLGLFTKKAW